MNAPFPIWPFYSALSAASVLLLENEGVAGRDGSKFLKMGLLNPHSVFGNVRQWQEAHIVGAHIVL